MNFQALTAIFLTVFLASCGDDISSNRKKSSNPGGNGNSEALNPENLASVSGIHREKGIDPLTYAGEIKMAKQGKTSPTYHAVPRMDIDDEGKDGSNVRSVSKLGRPVNPCGNAKDAALTLRIADCKNLNPDSHIWDGKINASSSEGIWELVSVSENKKEIWLDKRTGMLWSDLVTEGNWCQASGNDQSPADTTGATVDCKELQDATTLCIEDELIRWRLPTRNDYLLADVNGLRFVVKGTKFSYWTATMDSSVVERNKAWTYDSTQGTLKSEALSTKLPVRCVGAPKK